MQQTTQLGLHYLHSAATQQQLQLIQDMSNDMGLRSLNEDSPILLIADVASAVITDTTDTRTHTTPPDEHEWNSK